MIQADTPGRTTQACGIRDRTGEYERAGAVVLGVSPDPPEALRKFADKYGLRTYWGNQRATLVIAADGTVAKVFPKVSPKSHDDLVLDALGSLAPA